MIYIIDIEPVETRYTTEWKDNLPLQLSKATNEPIKIITGDVVSSQTTPGAFLNFGATNIYKSSQLKQIAELFCNDVIKDGDYFLYTDAWNPTVLQLKYMAKLLDINIQIGGMWHAGSYDPADFLGRIIGDEPWVRFNEMAMFEAYDHNFFATQFHIDMFKKVFFPHYEDAYATESKKIATNTGKDMLLADANKYKTFIESGHWAKFLYDQKRLKNNLIKTGWPMEYLPHTLDHYNTTKEDIILFPHRMSAEKQPEIFRDLATELPEYKFVFAQETPLTKMEYHSLLARAKIVFSANLQETLGISWYEGALVGAIPMVPDRLSYAEMMPEKCKTMCLYPSKWTDSFRNYLKHKPDIISRIRTLMNDNNSVCETIAQELGKNYFNGNVLYNAIRNRNISDKLFDRIA